MSVITDIKIRMARPEEAPIISLLIRDSFAEERSYYTEGAFAYTTPDSHIIKNRINNKTVWVAISANEIIATVSGVQREEGFFIRSMAVKKNARRTGLAKSLMNQMGNIALKNGCKKLELTTASFLVPAVKLYASLGFRQCGEKDLHGTILIKMEKNISN